MEVVILDIRQEQPTDYDAVYQVVKEAFADAGHTDGDEQNYLFVYCLNIKIEGLDSPW